MAIAAPAIAGVPVDFVLFAGVLAGIAVLHRHTLRVALLGLLAITAYKLAFSPFHGLAGLAGLLALLGQEAVLIANLFGLLLGFAVLAAHVEASRLPLVLPRFLPDDWKGGLVLLVLVFVISSGLDNIAAAMIGGTMASALYRGRVHVGFLAAIVAAANAGGSGSVLGDTTTTMMWIAGVPPAQVVEAYVAAVPALLFFAVFAARQQHALQPIAKAAPAGVRVDRARLAIVGAILAVLLLANVAVHLGRPRWNDSVPVLALAVWAVIAASAPVRRPDWRVLPAATRSAVFLLSLVLAAAMMPVEALPSPSWPGTLSLGFVSAVFDNIPLTALALKQGGYDWGFLAYAVGFGGSLTWFGSSAGVALAGLFPEARSLRAWIVGGWHVAIAYLIGFAVLLAVLGWHPDAASASPSATAAAGPR